MRILCVIDSLGSGGAQSQIVELALGFKESGHDVSFLIYQPQFFFREHLDIWNIPVHLIHEGNYLKRALKMRNFIRRGSYNSVLSFLEGANFICAFATFPNKQWKLVVGERSANPKILTSLKLKLYRLLHFRADYIVGNSVRNIQMVKKVNPFIKYSKFKVIYNAVDFKRWSRAVVPNQGKNRVFNLLVASRHQYIKNLKGLIHAVNMLDPEEKDKLLITWYGDEKKDNSLQDGLALINKFGLDGNFQFYPATRDIQEKKLTADAIGLFSLYEGFPNTICEAMALGKVVVSSNVSDIPLFLNHDLNLMCDPNSYRSIMLSIKYLLALSSEQLDVIGYRNYLVAHQSFEKSRIIQSYLNLLR
jgi:glycosyltransferase involved in cell wall biosynthesis